MVSTLEAPSGSRVSVLRAEDEHADLLAAFYREVWDTDATAARVRAARANAAASNPHGAGIDLPTFLFVDGERAAGHITTIPIRLWTGGRELDVHWLKGLMVLPEYRKGPVGYHVLREALRHVPIGLAAVVAEDARRLFTALGFKDVGMLSNRVRILSPGAVLRKLAAAGPDGVVPAKLQPMLAAANMPGVRALANTAARLSVGAWTLTRGRARLRGCILPEMPSAQEFDALWLSARSHLECAGVRDDNYLRNRYGAEGHYRWIGVYEDDRLRAFGAVRAPRPQGDPRLNGIRVATLSDLLVDPTDTRSLMALLKTAEQVALGLEAEALLCSASHTALLDGLQRRAYLPYSGNVHILWRSTDAKASWPSSLTQCWLTRGDSAADEVF